MIATLFVFFWVFLIAALSSCSLVWFALKFFLYVDVDVYVYVYVDVDVDVDVNVNVNVCLCQQQNYYHLRLRRAFLLRLRRAFLLLLLRWGFSGRFVLQDHFFKRWLRVVEQQ